ncbi:ExbD/TolR family protein [Aliikangiella coralliicola]|uniref:Biopolymer transporter ExbD n=1 Tax=Aliikangiella coralliicola TaxID=2592383 RepID=A0A545U021_9GAMM|nr:biopolymer transporter ExbD [Aliikangiella coralliicola]TQV82810.1 biopolymer transporter ExbD [Aliikangiella coralliicola]
MANPNLSANNTSLSSTSLGFNKIKKPVFATKLNLVALMDIFTILVFFLLLNAGDSQKLENAKFVKLPDSSADTAPHVEAIIMIGEDDIWLNDKQVVQVDDLLNSSDDSIEKVFSEALAGYKERRGELSAYEKENGLTVTIMGDKDVSFSLLKRVMTICSENDFREISLAVNRIATQSFLTVSGDAEQALPIDAIDLTAN